MRRRRVVQPLSGKYEEMGGDGKAENGKQVIDADQSQHRCRHRSLRFIFPDDHQGSGGSRGDGNDAEEKGEIGRARLEGKTRNQPVEKEEIDGKGQDGYGAEGAADFGQGEQGDAVLPAAQVLDLKETADVHQDQGQGEFRQQAQLR